MTALPSYSDVFSISHARDYAEEICAGQIVRTGDNRYPEFEVIAVNGDKAWVRNTQSGAESLALLERCRRVDGGKSPMAYAAE